MLKKYIITLLSFIGIWASHAQEIPIFTIEKYQNIVNIAASSPETLAKLKEKADNNNPHAQTAFGYYLEKKAQNAADIEIAIKYYEKSVASGSLFSQFRLGYIYAYNNLYPNDINKAMAYFKDAADGGHVEAKYYFGELNFYSGAPKSKEIALKYMNQAAKADYAPALNFVGNMLYRGDGVAPSKSLALNYYLKAAQLGNSDAMYQLGLFYSKGESVEADIKIAMQYFQLATQKKHILSQLQLGLLYIDKKEYDKALFHIANVAKNGNIAGSYYLGIMYYRGYGVKANSPKGIKEFKFAAENGNSDAQNILGEIYYSDPYIVQDKELAKKYFTEAAKQNNQSAKDNLLKYFNIEI